MYSTIEAATDYYSLETCELLESLILPINSSVKLNITGKSSLTANSSVRVYSDMGEMQFIRQNGEFGFSRSSLVFDKEGLYTLEYEGPSCRRKIGFVVGDANEVYGKYSNILTQIAPRDEFYSTAHSAISIRYNTLFSQNSSFRNRVDFQRQIVGLVESLVSLIASYRSSNPSNYFRDEPRFGGFRSSIDGQLQYYRLILPKVRASQKVPLFIVLPTLPSANRPYLQSAFVSRQFEADAFAEVARKMECAILWPGYRNRPYGIPSEFTHLRELFEHLESIEEIDLQSVHLLGICSSGATAAMFAAYWPGRFASLGLVNPMFARPKHRFGPISHAVSENPFYRDWVRAYDPTSGLLGLVGFPVKIVFDGAEPGHGEKRFSLDFLNLAREKKFVVNFVEQPKTLGYHMGAWASLIDWGKGIRSPLASWRRSTQYPMAVSAQGPISKVLAEPFRVVVGTQVAPIYLDALKRVATEFSKQWSVNHYNECVVKLDAEFTETDRAVKNLVLIGGPTSNSVWNEVVDEEKLSISRDSVKIGTQTWSGSSLSFFACVPRKGDKGNVIAIGGTDLASLCFPRMDLSIDGWYDVAVFRQVGEKVEELYYGWLEN